MSHFAPKIDHWINTGAISEQEVENIFAKGEHQPFRLSDNICENVKKYIDSFEQQTLTPKQIEIQKEDAAAARSKVIKRELEGKQATQLMALKESLKQTVELLINQAKNEIAPYQTASVPEADDSHQQNQDIQKTPDNSKVKQENLATIEEKHADSTKEAEQKVVSEVTPPDIKVGYVFIIESINPSHPENNSKTERTVISTEGDVIVVSVINLSNKSGKKIILKFNKEWNLIATRNADNSGLDYSPPLKYFGFPLSTGKTWQQTSTETNIKTGTIRKHKISGVVGEWEDITVPAGTFHAIKISLNTEVVNPVTGERSTGTDISWYAPDVKRTVKTEVTYHNETDNTEQKSVAQLISFNVGSK
jgi:hypothetical protein